jgi:hypothetical protein
MMDKRQVFDLARKAGFVDWTDDGDWQGTDCDLIRLVKMAFELGVKDGPDYKNGFADGAFEEREACAKLCETNQVWIGGGKRGFTEWGHEEFVTGGRHQGMDYADAIRARGND